jgi:hypothetical protein
LLRLQPTLQALLNLDIDTHNIGQARKKSDCKRANVGNLDLLLLLLRLRLLLLLLVCLSVLCNLVDLLRETKTLGL